MGLSCAVFSLPVAQVLATVAVFKEVAAAQRRGLVRKAADDAAKLVALIPAERSSRRRRRRRRRREAEGEAEGRGQAVGKAGNRRRRRRRRR